MTIGEKIKSRRLELNMTQSALARALGTTKQTIYKYETGVVTHIPLEKRLLLAGALRLTPGELDISPSESAQLSASELPGKEELLILRAFRLADAETREKILRLLSHESEG